MSKQPSTPYSEEAYILSILSLISPDMHAAAEKDLRLMLAKRSAVSAAPQGADLLEAIRLLELCVGNCDLAYDYHECMGVPLLGEVRSMRDIVEAFCARFR